jgi:hypothetical protein
VHFSSGRRSRRVVRRAKTRAADPSTFNSAPRDKKFIFGPAERENAPGQKQYLESFARHFSFSLSLWVYAEKKPGGYYFMRAGRNFSFHVLRLFARAPTFPLGCC